MTKPSSPDQLLFFLGADAVVHLERYFKSGKFTGGSFERFAGGGDRSAVRDRFTSDDVVAVSMLSVRVPGRAALAILEDRADELNGLLGEVPSGIDLWDAPVEAVAPGSPAGELWNKLKSIDGIGWVTAGKLLARKRPQLIPVYDQVVRDALGRRSGDGWWIPLRDVLTEGGVVQRLGDLRKESGIGDGISLLRVLDVCIWMAGSGKPEAVPDAET